MPEMNQREWDETGARATVRAKDPGSFLDQHTAPLFYSRTRPANGAHQTFERDEDFWAKSRELVFSSVCLSEFRLTDWFPRAPGIYWSRYGVRAREDTWSGGATDDPELGRIFNPRSKMGLIEEGGIGTIRLRPRRIDNTDCWFATAVKGLQCAGGVPLAVPDSLVREARVTWGETVTIHGQVRFLEDVGLEDTAASVHHASPVLVFVDTIEGASRRKQSTDPIVITPVVLFGEASSSNVRPKRHHWGGDVGYTFVQVGAGSDDELNHAEDWIEKYAAKQGGRVITNFDQHRPFLSDAPLSYQRLIKRTYDRTIIEHLHFNGTKLADRIDHVEQAMSVNVTLGDGTVIHGDFVVANSIKESFNRVKQSLGDEKLKDALQRLASQVGTLVEKLEPDTAQKAADALETLTKEAARPKPRREWWELSLEGLKDAAASVRDIGQPVIETVKTLVPLLVNAST